MKNAIFCLVLILVISCGKNETDKNLMLEVEKQQQIIDNQNERILQQEKIENERRTKLIQDSINLKIEILSNDLFVKHDLLEKAKKKLNDVTAFKLLRSSTTRNNEINSAQNEIDIIKSEISDIESELDQLQPSWRDRNK